jgi:hypothetical protein
MFFELIFTLLIISIVSLFGVLTLGVNKDKLEKYLNLLVALSVGALFG